MREKLKRYSGTMILDSFIYLLCLIGIYQVYLKAGLPIDLTFLKSGTIIKNNSADLYKNLIDKKIISIDGYSFKSEEELEIYLDGKKIGSSVELTISDNGIHSTCTVNLYSIFCSCNFHIIK